MPPTPLPTLFSDAACTVCGCVCDDLTITVEQGRVTKADGACRLALPWFLRQNATAAPPALVGGKPVPLADALDHAAGILRRAHSPLIYGLSRSTTEGQRAAVALADALGATIDTTASTGHAPSIMALQQVGESTCTLGEVKQRADLVIFWGSDPVTTHPRHLERYTPAEKYLVVVDAERTPTAEVADEFIAVPSGGDWHALWTLRLLVKGEPVAAAPEWVALAQRMKAARFGVVFFGAGLTRGPLAHRSVEALLQLVTDLNDHTRFYARRMRRYGDVAGADSVLTWQTGYPFAVNLALGYPRHNPGEFSAPDRLTRGEIDAALIVGGDTLADFPAAAKEALRRVPVILLDPPDAEPPGFAPEAQFATAVYGVHRPGTAYRLDEVPIPLRPILPTGLPSDADILTALLAKIGG